jgi:hypothetical protein
MLRIIPGFCLAPRMEVILFLCMVTLLNFMLATMSSRLLKME